MSSPRAAPYGTWSSPLDAKTVAAAGVRLASVSVDGDDIYWLEGRPGEGGRFAMVRRSSDGRTTDVLARDVNVRTRVHEYGGAPYAVAGGVVCYVNFADQRLYRVGAEAGQGPTKSPQPLTPVGPWRYADIVLDIPRNRLICVREDHGAIGREPLNSLVSIPLSGSPDAGRVIVSGADFYSTPRLSADRSRLSWISWRHPHMPWDETELWVAEVSVSGALELPRLVAGGQGESIYQPGWSPDGLLYFVSDRTGWWRLYRVDVNGRNAPNAPDDACLAPDRAELGRPPWILGTSTWAFATPSLMVAAYTQDGRWRLATIDVADRTMRQIAPDLQPAEWVAATRTHAVLIAGGSAAPDVLVRVDLESGDVEPLRAASSIHVDDEFISTAETVEFPTADGDTAHAFYYAPRSRDFIGLPGTRPPLIVSSHGGPTTAAKQTLDLQIQYWTSRGFALVDVNYRGSSGYGRTYRERLNGRWGIADVADVIHAARFLTGAGKVDGARLAIRGASAGGYTTLAALTFHPEVFRAGASYYGVSDIEALALETHKFESRYLDTLIGPYPERRDLYLERSPIRFVDRLACALILFQGLEDKVVPPSQSQMMADAVRAKGLPIAYLTFEGEQHGFRKAETIVRCLEAELSFYGAVFGSVPADQVDPVPIDNPSKPGDVA